MPVPYTAGLQTLRLFLSDGAIVGCLVAAVVSSSSSESSQGGFPVQLPPLPHARVPPSSSAHKAI